LRKRPLLSDAVLFSLLIDTSILPIVPVTSIIGLMALAILLVSMKGEGEAAEGALLFSPIIILASIVAGGIVGRIYS